MIDAAAAASQARSLLYGQAQQVTGIDVRPLQGLESSLIKLQDSANVTHNALSAKEAQFNATPLSDKAASAVKGLIAVKTNPVSAFFSSEKPGLSSPLDSFNENMRGVFKDVKPGEADTEMHVTAPAQPFIQRPITGLPPIRYEVGSTARPALPQTASPANFGQTEIRGNPFIPPQPTGLPPARSVQVGSSPLLWVTAPRALPPASGRSLPPAGSVQVPPSSTYGLRGGMSLRDYLQAIAKSGF